MYGATFVLPSWIPAVLFIHMPPGCRSYRRIFARSGNGQLRTTRAGHCGVERHPFAPYVPPNLRESPCLPDDTDRRAVWARWLCYSTVSAEFNPARIAHSGFRPVSFTFRAVRIYVKIGQALDGSPRQISHFSTVLHLSITESVGAALPISGW